MRATYGGFQLGFAAFLAWCALQPERAATGLFATALVVGAVGAGRAIGLLVDATPTAFHATGLVFEIGLAAVCILWHRRLPQSARMMGPEMKIGYVNVFVSDLERAIAFYRDTLGLALMHGAPEHGYAAIAAGSISLGLAVPGEADAALIGRHTGVGFAVDDLEAEHARLVSAGVTFPMAPSRQPWGGFIATFEDPDGNLYYLDEVSAAHG